MQFLRLFCCCKVAKLPNICRFVHICFAIKWVVERYNACISLYHIFKHKYLPCLRIIRKTQQQQTVYVHVQLDTNNNPPPKLSILQTTINNEEARITNVDVGFYNDEEEDGGMISV